MEKVRVDKWLWSVRIFKSRTIATDACKSGKIKINDTNAKSSATVKIGDEVEVKKNGFNFRFQVVKVIDKRVSAVLAAEAVRDITPIEEINKYKSWFTGKAMAETRDRGAGRPTKKDRRELEDFKDFSLIEMDWDDQD